MGNYIIVVYGLGQHHNCMPQDADRLAIDFIEKLKAEGHDIKSAVFINSGIEEIKKVV